MPDIVLVRPAFYGLFGTEEKVGNIPLGLLYIASCLEEAGYGVKVLDCETLSLRERLSVGKSRAFHEMNREYDFYRQIMEDPEHPLWSQIVDSVLKLNPEVIGFSACTPTMTFVNLVSRKLRKQTDAKIILGGPHPTALPHRSLAESGADYVVVGEGERSMRKILNGSEDQVLRSVPFNPLDDLPFPSRHLLNPEHYTDEAMGYIVSSRGCPYNCLFCASHSLWGRNPRFRSAENLADEIEQVYNTYRTRRFRFTDDLFGLDKKRVKAFGEDLRKRGVDIRFRCGNRVDTVDRELLELLKKAGCYQISYGVESGNQRILDLIRKGTSVDQAVKAISKTKEVGINTIAFFMVGHPTETLQEIQDTVRLIEKVDADRTGLNLVTPLPGTDLVKYVGGEENLNGDWWKYFFQGKAFKSISNLSDDCLNRVYSKISKWVAERNSGDKKSLSIKN